MMPNVCIGRIFQRIATLYSFEKKNPKNLTRTTETEQNLKLPRWCQFPILSCIDNALILSSSPTHLLEEVV